MIVRNIIYSTNLVSFLVFVDSFESRLSVQFSFLDILLPFNICGGHNPLLSKFINNFEKLARRAVHVLVEHGMLCSMNLGHKYFW